MTLPVLVKAERTAASWMRTSEQSWPSSHHFAHPLQVTDGTGEAVQNRFGVGMAMGVPVAVGMGILVMRMAVGDACFVEPCVFLFVHGQHLLLW